MHNRFENARKVNSPGDFSRHPQTARSTIINSSTQSSYSTSRINTGRAQVAKGFYNNPITQSFVSQQDHTYSSSSNYNPKKSMVGSHMMESTIFHTRKQTCNLAETRLSEITKKFMKQYATAGQIRRQNAQQIQRQANSHIQFEQDQQTVQQLMKAMDQNRDKRVTQDDVLALCRRYLSFERRTINYTPTVEEKLAVARRLFKQFDVQKNGYLTAKQVPYLLKETYRSLGRDFNATEQDVRSWMKLTDNDNDGRVFLPQYERSIVRALKKQGVKIYDE